MVSLARKAIFEAIFRFAIVLVVASSGVRDAAMLVMLFVGSIDAIDKLINTKDLLHARNTRGPLFAIPDV
jgi:hypothetical protein